MQDERMVQLHQKVKISEEVFAQEVDGEMVLLDMKSEEYFGMDEVGTATWNALQGTQELTKVLEVLQNQYDVEPGVLQKDLLSFVGNLVQNGLIEVCPQ